MTAIAIRALTHLIPEAQTEHGPLKLILLFCGLGLCISLVITICGMDLSDAWL
jgi:hypothetical protein